jgi:hypothetical protein
MSKSLPDLMQNNKHENFNKGIIFSKKSEHIFIFKIMDLMHAQMTDWWVSLDNDRGNLTFDKHCSCILKNSVTGLFPTHLISPQSSCGRKDK